MKKILDLYIFSLLISLNLFFAIFVWKPNDLSPNFVLLVFTIVPSVFLLRRILTKENKHGNG